jgi:hypothetical protein
MSKTYKDSRNAKADRDPRRVAQFRPLKHKHDEQDWDSQLDDLLNEHSELWEDYEQEEF